MKNKNIILQANSLNIIKKAKEVGITTFLFPITSFCVGYKKTYDIRKIKEQAFILINRNLDNDDIDRLKELLNDLPNNIIGIVFEDLGLINILKTSNLIKIYNAKHLNCSSLSVNYMLEYVDSIILSTDLTIKEITNIIDNAKKPLSIYAFGLNSIFYSRRTLISNYAKEYNLGLSNEVEVKDNISNEHFKIIENDYGTVFYTGKFYNALQFFNNDKIKYYFVNLTYLEDEKAMQLLDRFNNSNYSLEGLDIANSLYNLNKEIYYKLPPKEGDKNE